MAYKKGTGISYCIHWVRFPEKESFPDSLYMPIPHSPNFHYASLMTYHQNYLSTISTTCQHLVKQVIFKRMTSVPMSDFDNSLLLTGEKLSKPMNVSLELKSDEQYFRQYWKRALPQSEMLLLLFLFLRSKAKGSLALSAYPCGSISQNKTLSNYVRRVATAVVQSLHEDSLVQVVWPSAAERRRMRGFG